MKFIIFILFILVVFTWLVLKSRNMQLWIGSYIRNVFSAKHRDIPGHKHIYVCLADHFEPYYRKPGEAIARQRVSHWIDNYVRLAKQHTDSDGKHPQHSYFYPVEEYDEWILDELSKVCKQGLGDVEIHLHHDNDTDENLEKTLLDFKELLYSKHGLLRKNAENNIVYGFIHGNWALDNSRPDGKWCGIDNELDVLVRTGCEYDMTMPSAPSDTQTSTINSIYIAKEDGKCKSHDKGRPLKVGDWKKANELLMIQGPLTLNWSSRKFGLIPRIESSELSWDNPPAAQRVALWENCHVSVKDAETHIFIKLHTHGLEESNPVMFFDNGGFETLWNSLEQKYKNNDSYKLHYVTAWELYSKIKSLSCGEDKMI